MKTQKRSLFVKAILATLVIMTGCVNKGAKNLEQDLEQNLEQSLEQDLFKAAQEAWIYYADESKTAIEDFLKKEPYFDVSSASLQETGLVGGWRLKEIDNKEIGYDVFTFFMEDGHFFTLASKNNIFGYWTAEEGKIYVADPDNEYYISEINYNKDASTLKWGDYIYKIERY